MANVYIKQKWNHNDYIDVVPLVKCKNLCEVGKQVKDLMSQGFKFWKKHTHVIVKSDQHFAWWNDTTKRGVNLKTALEVYEKQRFKIVEGERKLETIIAKSKDIPKTKIQTSEGLIDIDKLMTGRVFFLTKDQVKKYEAWYKKQKKVSYGVIGGGIIFKFIPTGVGTMVEVEYNKKTLDLTEDLF